MSLLRGAGPYSVTFDWGADVGDVTLEVTDANGDEVVAAGTATTNNADGTYTYASLPNQSDVGILTFTWTDDGTTTVKTQRIHVFGSLLFTEDEARAFTITGQQTPLSSTSTYPAAVIDEWHDRIARMFEQKTGRSWVERYARIEIAGSGGALDLSAGVCRSSTGTPILAPGRTRDISEIISVTVGGTVKTTYEIDGSILRSTSGTWSTPSIGDPLNIVVEYQYGVPDDFDANENALRMLAAKAIPSDLSSSAVSWSNEDGSFSRDTSGWSYPTDVFEWLKRNPSRPFA